MTAVITYVVAFAVALAVYLSNGETISSYDAVPNSLLAFGVLADHRLDFDRLRGGYFGGLGGGYAFVEAPNGHLTSVFPIGTALVTAPLYAALYAARTIAGQPTDIASPAFEPVRLRDEKLAAAVVAALAVALFLAVAHAIATPLAAALATVAFAFGTETWMIGSQGLWQHGSVELVVLAMIAALLAAVRTEHPARRTVWVFVAGLCIGLLPVVRPTALAFALPGFVFAATWFARRALPALAGGTLLGLAPGAAWNLFFFHSLLGGYAANTQYLSALGGSAGALAGLLVSPSRGILIFTPLVLLAAFGFARIARERTAEARLLTFLAVGSLALGVGYAGYAGWLGGDAYGPRFLTDVMPVAMLLVAYGIPLSVPVTVAYAPLLAWSVGVQAVGAFSGAAGPLWNAIPVALARAPERVWQLTDSQIERNARATYYHYVPDYPTGGTAYTANFTGTVTAVRRIDTDGAPLAGRPGEAFEAVATARNTGRSPWFGYASAVYNRETRIRARIVDGRGRLVSEQELYLEGNTPPGAPARAIGTLRTPDAAGTYTLQCDVIALGATTLAGAPLRVPLSVGERLAAIEKRGVSL